MGKLTFSARLTLGSVLVASAVSCGSSSDKVTARDGGGAGGEAGEPPGPSAGTSAQGGETAAGAPAAAGASGEAADGAGGAGGAGDGGSLFGLGGADGGSAGAVGEGGAAPLPSRFRVFNTGVDDQGVVLAGASIDPHYTLVQSPDSSLPGPNAIVTEQIAEGYWLPQSETSKWIAPSANQSYPGASPCNATGTYVWRTAFRVEESELDDFSIAGGWAADNIASAVRLNGEDLGLTPGGYGALVPFTIDGGFVAGINTLEFEVIDQGCPNGLRVELTASVDVPPG